jgi:hypothetical protein
MRVAEDGNGDHTLADDARWTHDPAYTPDLHSAAVPVEERARPAPAAQPVPGLPGWLASAARHRNAPTVSLTAIAVVAFVLLMYLARGVGFYFDEWNFVLDRVGHSPKVFLEPHNEHIAVLPVFVYKVLLELFGLDHHWPFLVVLLVMHVLLGVGVYLLARPRVGPWAAVMVATLILFAGLAYQNMLWAFQIGFVGSVLGGVWAWVALDSDTRWPNPFACGALLFSMLSSSLGVPMALGVAAELLAGGRRRALWVPLAPLVLYAIWYAGYGDSHITSEGILHAAPWAMTAVAAAAGALFGLGTNWGVVLAVLCLVGLWRRLSVGGPTPRLVGLIVAGVAFWALTGAARSVFQPPVPPESSRYLTFGMVVLALVGVELAVAAVVVPRLLALGAAVTLLAVALGLPVLRDNGRGLRTTTDVTNAAIGAMELVARSAPATYQPDPGNAPQLFAGKYFAATKRFGSTAGESPSQLATASSAERETADRVLQELAARPHPATPSARGTAPALEKATGARVTDRQGCAVVRRSAGASAVVSAAIPQTGAVVRALGRHGVTVWLRRFADGFANAPVTSVTRAEAQLVRLPADAAPQPYHIQLAGRGDFALCAA